MSGFRLRTLTLLLSFFVAVPSLADRPKVGLVLSGGGTKGGAHLGVIRVLEQHRVPVDVIVGTSIGAVMGGLYASGMSADDMEQAIRAINWDQLLQDRTPRKDQPFRRKREHHDDLIDFKPGFGAEGFKLPLGLVQGHGVSQFLRRSLQPVAQVEHFDELPIPFRAVSTDLLSGKQVVPESGDLVAVIRASMTIPAVLSPVSIDGRLLVDGGMVNNLPVDIARQLGADIIIAVDITSPMLKEDEITSLLSVTDQVINLMTSSNVEQSVAALTPSDVLIRPDVEGPQSINYESIATTVDQGMAAAREFEHRFEALSLSEQDYAAWREHSAGVPPNQQVATIHINNQTAVGDKLIRHRLDLHPGDPFDPDALQAGIARVFGLELFGRVDYQTRPSDTGVDIHIDATPRSWGPSYLQFGLQLEEDFANDAEFDFAVGYLQTAVNPLGGEWQAVLDLGANQGLSFEWYQPMTWTGSWYIRPKIEYARTKVRRYNTDGDATDELRIQGVGAEFFAGADLNDHAQFELGWDRLWGNADRIVGQAELPGDDFEIGEMMLRARYDSLDRVNLPNRGLSLDLTGLLSRSYTGGSDEYEQVFGSALTAFSFGRYRIIANVEAGKTINETAPPQTEFTLGGFGRLSGYPADRFRGQNFGLLNLSASRWMSRDGVVPLVLGYSMELGQAWTGEEDKWLPAGSIFVAFDTPIGPTYIATGLAPGGNKTLYLYLGNPLGQQQYRPFD